MHFADIKLHKDVHEEVQNNVRLKNLVSTLT